MFLLWLCTVTTFGANAIIFAFAPIENENRTLDQEEQKNLENRR
ncbi:accessory gene regulator B family protein [Roseburia faecis]